MFNASEKYLEALYEGDILKFLEWPQWLITRDVNQNRTQDADELINLIKGEWLRCEYTEKDTSNMAIVYLLANERDSLLISLHAYAAMALCGAAIQCMVYRNIIIAEKLPEVKSNFQLLNDAETTLVAIGNQQKAQFYKARKQLNDVFMLRTITEAYIHFLKNPKVEKDDHWDLRLDKALNMQNALLQQTKYPLCQDTIKPFINSLRQLSPSTIEETDFLSYLSPMNKTPFIWTAINAGLCLFLPKENITNDAPILLKDKAQYEPVTEPAPGF
jgi:hypothetical protein